MSLKLFYKLWDTESMETFSEIMETIMLSLNQLFWLIKIGPQRLCNYQYFIHWFNIYWLCIYFLPSTGDSSVDKILRIVSKSSLPYILLFLRSINFFFQLYFSLILICLSPSRCKNLIIFFLNLTVLIMENKYEEKHIK